MPIIWNVGPDGSGTAQQRAWVNEAIAACSYPLKNLDILVRVKWGAFPTTSDTRHPYMTTNVFTDGWMQVTIAPWADDPSRPENQGLPNPAADIKDFYKQSFVHEIGHLVTFVTADPFGEGKVLSQAELCTLFWRYEQGPGSGIRWGTSADWKALGKPWADEIIESVAEFFKIAFYTGRLIFGNRTNWNLSKQQWARYLALLSVARASDATVSGQTGGVKHYPFPPDIPLILPCNVSARMTVTGLDEGESPIDPPDDDSITVQVTVGAGASNAHSSDGISGNMLLQQNMEPGQVGVQETDFSFVALAVGLITITIDMSGALPDVIAHHALSVEGDVFVQIGTLGNPFTGSTAPIIAGNIHYEVDIDNAPNFSGDSGFGGISGAGSLLILVIDLSGNEVLFPLTHDFPFADPSISLGTGYRGNLRLGAGT